METQHQARQRYIEDWVAIIIVSSTAAIWAFHGFGWAAVGVSLWGLGSIVQAMLFPNVARPRADHSELQAWKKDLDAYAQDLIDDNEGGELGEVGHDLLEGNFRRRS